jgi:hypothetical protein
MRGKNWTKGVAGVALLLFLTLCLLPIGGASTAPRPDGSAAEVSEASVPASAPVITAVAPIVSSPAATLATVAPAVSPARSSVPVSSNTAVENEAPMGDEAAVAEEPDPDADTPSAAAWTSQAPANFKVTYNVSTHTATCTWSAITSPAPHDYQVYKWTQDSYTNVYSYYQQLAALDPTAKPYFTDLDLKVNEMLNSPGLTIAERQAKIDAIEVDLDALNGIMCSNPAASSLLTQLKSAASKATTTSTTWNDTNCNDNYFYWYAVVTRNSSHQDSSPFSHGEAIFAVRNNSTTPAVPTGVKATAYDPGVVVEWARNTEYDLAGYNVYSVSGSTWTKLNASLITTGTEYYYSSGTAGQIFGVTAVDASVPARESAKTAKATAALAAATTYVANDAGWVTSGGTWKIENYTTDGGSAILVSGVTSAQASHVFSGRRIKLAVSTYWSCGVAKILIDGVDYGTCNLNSAAMAWNVKIFTASGLAKGSHTLTIQVTGTGGSGDLHFVNVQSIEVR